MRTHLFTVYCQHAHRLLDGVPIGHPCRILHPEFLDAERGGDAVRAIGLLSRMRLVLHPGIPSGETSSSGEAGVPGESERRRSSAAGRSAS